MAAGVMQVRVEGIEPLLKRLKALPDRMQRAVLRPAVSKSSQVVVKAARKLAPRGDGLRPDGSPRTPLHKSIKKTRAKLNKKTGTVYVVVGPERSQESGVYHSHLVHEGTQPHDITLTKPLNLGRVTLPAGFTIRHPGASANPFLENAVQQTQGQVQQKLKTEIAAGIDKQVRKLASMK